LGKVSELIFGIEYPCEMQKIRVMDCTTCKAAYCDGIT
jgi:hypothetical protein